VTAPPSARRPGIAILFAAVLALAGAAPAAVAEGGEWTENNDTGPERELLEAVKANDLPRAARIAERMDLSLLHSGYDNPLTAAVRLGELPMLRMLLERGAPITISYPQEYGGGHDVGLLETALRSGQFEIARYLVDRGASPLFLLVFAAQNQNDELFEYGLAESRDLNETSMGGMTPLMYACGVGRLDYVAALVKKGADVNASKSEPYMWGYMDEVAPSSELWKGDALQVAIQAGQWRVIRYLLDGGAAPTVYDLEAALNATMTSLADELLLRGAKPRDATLVAACRAQDLRMATELLGMGLDPNARDYNGQAALGVAKEARFDALARLLISRGAREPEKAEDFWR
jgi:ankyrin repeat protein